MSSLTITMNDGNKIPWLGFGTGTAFYLKDAENAVHTAIANGIVHLDGAQMYNNEESLGAGIAASGKPRSSLFVTTKMAKIPPGQTVRDTLLISLKKLRLDYVDLFLVHAPMLYGEGQLGSVWKQVEEVQKEGLAKSIGVSNFRIQDFEEFIPDARVIPAVNQIEYHPYVFAEDKALLEYMKKHNILPTSYGGLTPLVRWKGGSLDPVLTSIAERVSKTAGQPVSGGQVLQLWLREQGIPAITTTTKESRLKEYLAVETLPSLTAEEMHAIEEAGAKEPHRRFVIEDYVL